MFKYFQEKRERAEKAQALYVMASDQSRHVDFYDVMQVPDTFEGRFEVLSLHIYMMMRRLKAEKQEKLSQKLFDVMFCTMDKTLREIGIGDLGVPKHMKRMMQGFNGRAQSYEKALSANDNDALIEALTRNIYGTLEGEPDRASVEALAVYVETCAKIIAEDQYFVDMAPIEEAAHG